MTRHLFRIQGLIDVSRLWDLAQRSAAGDRRQVTDLGKQPSACYKSSLTTITVPVRIKRDVEIDYLKPNHQLGPLRL